MIYYVLLPSASQCLHWRRRWWLGSRLDTNHQRIQLKDIINSINKSVPNQQEVILLETNVKQYLGKMCTKICKKLKFTVKPTLTGSASERFGVPICPDWTDFSDIVDDKHALLTGLDFMVIPEDMCACYDDTKHLKIIPDNPDAPLGFVRLQVMPPGTTAFPEDLYKNLKTGKITGIINRLVKVKVPRNDSIVKKEVHGPSIEVSIGTSLTKAQQFITLFWLVFTTSFCEFIAFLFEKKYFHPVIVAVCIAVILVCIAITSRGATGTWTTTLDWFDLIGRFIAAGVFIIIKFPQNLRVTMETLYNNGFLSDDDTTWRYSFSIAERKLSKLVPETARKCILALKTLGKDHLKPGSNKLASYHLKTVFLNMMQDKTADFWREEEIEECFHALLDRVIKAVENRQCPHLWIDGDNLFKDLDWWDSWKLLRVLNEIKQDPVPYINSRTLMVEECCCFDKFGNDLEDLDNSVTRHVVGSDGQLISETGSHSNNNTM